MRATTIATNISFLRTLVQLLVRTIITVTMGERLASNIIITSLIYPKARTILVINE